ncbi:MAG: hypothetical protein QGF03_05070, partial [SAR324 cluster bacterium]|nr:hypothetical protein [SAR324 cluster bacterium]
FPVRFPRFTVVFHDFQRNNTQEGDCLFFCQALFNLPGLGNLMLLALNQRDYPVVSGVNLFFATMVVGINLMIDLIYPYLGSAEKHFALIQVTDIIYDSSWSTPTEGSQSASFSSKPLKNLTLWCRK